MKHPGESVRANEAVVELGNLDKLASMLRTPGVRFSRQGGANRRDPPRLTRARASRCPSRRSGSAARSHSSIPRSSRSPRPPCISGPSSTTRERAQAGPPGPDDHFRELRSRRRRRPDDAGPTQDRTALTVIRSRGWGRSGTRHRDGAASPSGKVSLISHEIRRASRCHECRYHHRPPPERSVRPPNISRSGYGLTWSSSPSSMRG